MVKSPLANAGDWFSPWSQRIPRAGKQLSLRATTSERNYWAHVQQLLKHMCPRAHAAQQEKQLESSRWLLQLEKSPRSSECPAQT